MSHANDIESQIQPVLSEAGIELVQVEYQREPGGWVLRVYIDKPGGVGLVDCQEWSRSLGDLIESKGLLTGPYSLEVSSPGLSRPLKKRDDFQRFLGLEAVIKLYAARNNQKNFHGRLMSLENEELSVMDRTSGVVKIPLNEIASAKLDVPI